MKKIIRNFAIVLHLSLCCTPLENFSINSQISPNNSMPDSSLSKDSSQITSEHYCVSPIKIIPNPQNDEAINNANKYAGIPWKDIFSTQDCPSIAFLKAVLGKEYNADPLCLKQNLEKFIQMYGKLQNKNINTDPYILKTLCDLIDNEQSEYENKRLVLYHGCTGKILLLFKYFAQIYSIISEQQLDEFGRFRGSDIFLLDGDHPYSSVWEILKKFNDMHYGKDIEKLLMFFNISLFHGPRISLSSSSSLLYFLCNFSVNAPKYSDLIVESFMLHGMSGEDAWSCYEKLESLWSNFFESLNPGGILAVSVPFEYINILTNAGGSKNKKISTFDIYKNLQNLACNWNQREPFDKLSQDLKNDFVNASDEVRMYLNPEFQFKVVGKFSKKLSEKDKVLFDSQFNAIVSDAVNKLQLGVPTKNSFYKCPIWKTKSALPLGGTSDMPNKQNNLFFALNKGLISVIEILYPEVNLDTPEVFEELKKGIIQQNSIKLINFYEKKTGKLIWGKLLQGDTQNTLPILENTIKNFAKLKNLQKIQQILSSVNNDEIITLVLTNIANGSPELWKNIKFNILVSFPKIASKIKQASNTRKVTSSSKMRAYIP